MPNEALRPDQSKIVIRKALPQELSDIYNLCYEVIDKPKGLLRRPPTANDLNLRTIHIGAYINKYPVGTIRLSSHLNESSIYMASRFAVKVAFRDIGVGGMLLNSAENSARMHGGVQVIVYVNPLMVGYFQDRSYKLTSVKREYESSIYLQMMKHV